MASTSLLGWPLAAQGISSNSPPFPDTREPRRVELPAPICFPPNPPPLGRPVAPSVRSAGQYAAPEELAAFVNEPFYPQLSTRLLTRSLNEKQRGELERYRAAKRAAQAELRAELARVRDAEADTRRQALVRFAARQTPRLVELEKAAEVLRHDLAISGKGWDDLREWHLADSERRGFSPLEIAQVLRSYAYYRAGLSAGQRRLLREIAIELLMAGDSAEKAAANQPHVFFQPELARVTFPESLPVEVSATIAQFQTRKANLKKELFDAVRSHDGARLAFLHNPVRSLATRHTAEIAELERIAESIRAGLATQAANLAAGERSPLPPALTQRLGTLLRNRDLAEREATSEMDALVKSHRSVPARVNYRFDGNGLRFVVIPLQGRRTLTKADADAITELRSKISAVADDYGRRIAELLNELDAIRRDAGEAIGSSSRAAIDAALAAANRAQILKGNEAAYADYRTAVFEPGLSPEQRRLLFDAAIEDLGLRLPDAELQPTRRADTW